MLDFVEDGKFYLQACGEQIKGLPDIPLVLRPILDTSLHAFAVEGWTFSVRHSGGWKTPFRSPKIVLRHESTHCVISFRLGPKPRFNNQFDVAHALRGWMGELNFKSCTATVTKPQVQLDELDMLKKFNEERFERISKNRPVSLRVRELGFNEPTVATLLDLAEYRGRARIKSTALAMKGVFAALG